MALLEIKNLHARVSGNGDSQGIDLTVNAGEVHAIMGPNGSGKSTLAQVLAGRDLYDVTGGEVLYDGKDLLEMSPEERAREGIFLAFQYPVEIPGVSNMYFLKAALNTDPQAPRPGGAGRHGFPEAGQREDGAHGDGPDAAEPPREHRLFRRRKEAQRDFPDGRAGAEAGDSRRDRFRPGHRRAEDRRRRRQRAARPERAMIVVTHYQRLLNYIVPDYVHVLAEGRIVKSGGKELALELEADRLCRASEEAVDGMTAHSCIAIACRIARRGASPSSGFPPRTTRSGASPTSRRSPEHSSRPRLPI